MFSCQPLNPCDYSLLGIGCEVNATLFAGEMKKHRLRTLSPATNNSRKTKLKNPGGSCIINISSSWYIGCLGKKVPLGLHSDRTTEMFLLQRKPKKDLMNRSYFIEVRVALVLVGSHICDYSFETRDVMLWLVFTGPPYTCRQKKMATKRCVSSYYN